MCLRDRNRYGRFKANSDVGEIIIEISISGWGEEIKIYQNKELIGSVDTVDDEEDYYEDDNRIDITMGDYKNIVINKPFIRCIKRFK